MRPQQTEKHTFFAPRDRFAGEAVVFPEAEARHATKVLRLQPGNLVQVVDGEGGRFRVRIEQARKDSVLATVVESAEGTLELPISVTLAAALIKNSNRFETVLEKATELGVTRIVPLITERTEKPRIKRSRYEAILVAAMKQSGRARLPSLDDPTPLTEFLDAPTPGALNLMCHEQASAEDGMLSGLRTAPAAPAVVCAIGPEGGFSDEEIEAGRAAGYRIVSLGPIRLRADTAAIAALAAIALERGS